MKRFMAVFMGTILLAVAAGSANAAVVTWTLQDWVFDDGGTASGTFTYDADTDTFGSINIVTTAGSTLAGASYGIPIPSFPGSSTFLDLVTGPSADFIGFSSLGAVFLTPLTNAGGVSFVDTNDFFSSEGPCGDAICSFYGGDIRRLNSGSVSAVPMPAAIWFFASSLLGLLGVSRRRAAAGLRRS